MPNLTLTIGQLRITPFFWSLCLALVFSSFSFWRKLREDYKEEEIFGLSLFIFVSSLFFFWLVFFLMDNTKLSLVSVFCGAVLAVKAWSFRFKKNIWEILDGLTLPLLYLLFFGGIGLFLKTLKLWELEFSLTAVVSFALFEYSCKRYRSFAWYKSGKIGFLFLEVNCAVFLVLSMLAFFRRDALYWERFIMIFGCLLSAVVLYCRSERNFRSDFKIFFNQKWQK